MSIKYVSGTGSDTGSAGPFATLIYALAGSRCAWGDTLVVQAGATFGTASSMSFTLGAGTGGDFTVIAEDETVVLTIPPTFTLNIYLSAAPSANTFINWGVSIINPFTTTCNNGLFIFYNTSVTGAFLNFHLGGKAADHNHTPITIDAGATMDAGTISIVSVTSTVAATSKIKISQAILKNVKSGVVKNACDAVNCIPAFEFASAVIRDYGYLYFSGTAGTSMDLTLLNTSRYGLRGYNITQDVTELQMLASSANITKLKEHNSILSRCCRYADKEFGEFSAVPIALMQDVLLNQSTKWFRSSTVYHQAIPFVEGSTNCNDFVMPVRASGRQTYIPFSPTNWFLDPNYIDAPAGNFKIDPTKVSWISGRGDINELPPTDIEGYPWTGADIGAYRNPTAKKTYPTINKGLRTVGGDSIGLGASISGAQTYPAENFLQAFPPWSASIYGSTYASIGGVDIGGYQMVIDYLMTSGYAPEYLGLVLGANNGTPYLDTFKPPEYDFAETAPYYNTAIRFAADIAVIFKKYMDWAGKSTVYPIWLGCGPAVAITGAWSYANQQGFSDAFTKYLGKFVSGVDTSHYIDEMKRARPTDWYSGDYYAGVGTKGPYYDALYPNGEASLGELNIHPHEGGYLFIAEVFRTAISNLTKKKTYSSSGGIFGSNFGSNFS